MKLLRIVLSLLLLSGLVACGSKRSPTGGDKDTEMPTVLSSSPAIMGDISSKVIEIDFSKPMDRSSITSSVYIYPPVSEKRISLSRSTLRIEIIDELKDDTIYFVTLSTRLKDLRGNNLERANTLVFRHGEPETARLSGLINYENPLDNGLPIIMSLFSADSLLVMMDEARGASYEIPSLIPQSYNLRAYIDKNRNGHYDVTQEPFFDSPVLVEARTTMDLNMAYVDTTLAQIRQIQVVSPHELEVHLNKPIDRFGILEITSDEVQPPEILHQYLQGDILRILTTQLDSLSYTLRMRNMEDAKGNLSVDSSIRFTVHTLKDDQPPRLISSVPRHGATIDNTKPQIELTFSEIMTRDNLHLSLMVSDTKAEAEFRIVHIQGRKVILEPVQELINYRSYSLIIHGDSQDYYGNHMGNDVEIVFLPIKR
nr:hypothetical protein [Candidatus Cloacimonadota bacterium]